MGVKIIFVPVQMVVVLALTVTAGVSIGLTVMVMPVLVAVAGEAQPALDVNTTVKISAFEIALVTYVLFVAPVMITAFFFH